MRNWEWYEWLFLILGVSGMIALAAIIIRFTYEFTIGLIVKIIKEYIREKQFERQYITIQERREEAREAAKDRRERLHSPVTVNVLDVISDLNSPAFKVILNPESYAYDTEFLRVALYSFYFDQESFRIMITPNDLKKRISEIRRGEFSIKINDKDIGDLTDPELLKMLGKSHTVTTSSLK